MVLRISVNPIGDSQPTVLIIQSKGLRMRYRPCDTGNLGMLLGVPRLHPAMLRGPCDARNQILIVHKLDLHPDHYAASWPH